MHGQKVALHLERLWDRNISIATRLVDTVTIPMLFKSVGSHKIDPKRLKLDSILDAMTTSGTRPKQKRSR
jgi:alcohol dehydrogenase